MKTWQLIVLRIYGLTFGRITWMSLALKKFLVFCLIKRSRRKYVAASRYFALNDFLNNRGDEKRPEAGICSRPSGCPGLEADFSRVLFAGLVILFGLLLFAPALNLVSYLVQGDLGRDLYAYQRALSGDLPYRDYYYSYGPLMHYYYALFFKLFGVEVPSVLLGQVFLQILSGLLVYSILALWISPALAMVAGCWLCAFSPGFLYTFNNTGAVFFLLAQIYFLSRYFQDSRRVWLWRMVPVLSALFLIKLNIGGAVWAASLFLIFVFSNERGIRKRFKEVLGQGMIFSLPLLFSGLVYGALFWGLPDYFLKQSIPIWPGYDQFRDIIPLGVRLKILWRDMVLHLRGLASDGSSTSFFPVYWPYQVLFLMFFSSLAFFISFLFKKDFRRQLLNEKHVFILLMFALFALTLFHEFFLTGILYKLWPVFPVVVLGVFFLSGIVMKTSRLYKMTVMTLCVGILALQVHGKYAFKSAIMKNPQQYLSHPRLKIYVKNPPEWNDTVLRVADYLKRHLKSDELFLAIPYEPLYYYLADKRSPIPEIMIFDLLHIVPEQELRMLEDLEKGKVNYVLVSNRHRTIESGLGEFGKTYCPRLAAYVKQHFRAVEVFGTWNRASGWFAPHGIKIFKRVDL